MRYKIVSSENSSSGLYGPLDDEVVISITHFDVLVVNPATPLNLKDTDVPTLSLIQA